SIAGPGGQRTGLRVPSGPTASSPLVPVSISTVPAQPTVSAPAPAPLIPIPAPGPAPIIPAPALPSGIKFAKPPMYNGKDKEKLEEFELKCSMYLDSHDPRMHPKTKINFVTGYLEEEAQRWLTPFLIEEGRTPFSVPFLNDWGLFWNEMEHRFGEHNKIEKFRLALGKLKQTKDVQSYLYEFQRYAQPLNYGDNDLRD
ncbi:retrotransposon gag protein, partial [Rhizoctonia solani 123E]